MTALQRIPSVKLLKFADDTTVIGLIKDRDESAYRQAVEQLAVWCILRNLELNTLKTVEMIVDFRRTPPPRSPLTHHHGQHCGLSRVIQIPGNHHLSGPEEGQAHWLYCEKGPAEAVFPPPAKEVQPATGAAETVLLCHHWDCTWFGSATKTDIRRLQRTTMHSVLLYDKTWFN